MEVKARDTFDESVKKALGGGFSPGDFEDPKSEVRDAETPTWERYEDDDEGAQPMVVDIDDADPDTYDQYVGAEVILPHGSELKSGKVVGRRKTAEGQVRGKANKNPILDTRTYDVEFRDGEVKEYTANVIAENMYAQCDGGGINML